MMSDRDVWVQAGAIFAEHGAGASDYIISQLCDVLGDMEAVQDWRRVANAVDAIEDAVPQ